ncbi:hypothetical protein HPB50_024459 [Hyalomma asiaticum]|uniref:Uncharacterized protein n=1 Tax=Hyalomma asiaticum TaxID=266040 RepID=A0ACB7SC13_HYAAI|nr:hypothetical protein HPB50_024459 [Hyalomma asiaticum]
MVPDGATQSIVGSSQSRRLQASRKSTDLGESRESFVDHTGGSRPSKKAAAAYKRSSFSTATAETMLSAPDTLGGATDRTQVLRSTLQDLEKPEAENPPVWQSLRAVIVETVRHERRRFITLVFLSTAAGVVLLCLYGDNITAACTNFASFVCSAVRSRHGAMAESVIAQRFMDSTLTSAAQPMRVSIFSRPFEMTRKCIGGSTADDDLTTLVKFLQDKSFAWPTPNGNETFPDASSKNYSQPLYILFDLAVTWQTPVWFRCHLFLPQKGRRRAIRLSPSPMGYISQRLHELFLSSSTYTSYVSFIESLVFSLRKPTSEFLSFVRSSRKMQEDVFSRFANVFNDPLFVPKRVPLAKMSLLVPRFTVDDWLRPLQKVYDADPLIDHNDMVLATNSRLLAAMNDLLEAYTPQEITFHIIWWYAQYACTITSRVLFNAVSSSRFGMQVQREYCTVLSKEVYHVLWAAVSKARTSIEDQIRISSYLENIKTVAVDKLTSTTRFDSVTRDSLASVVMNVGTIIWPNGSLATPEGLEHYYGPAHDGFGGVFGEAYATVRYLRRFIGTYQGDLAAAMFIPSEYIRLTLYDPLTNTIAMATEAIGPPLYYSSGTSAMIYGGLGFIYSLEVVTALNSISHLTRDEASAVSAQSSNKSFSEAPSCPNVHSLFPELPALDLAHEAYLRFRDAQSDLPLKGLRYSPEQIFFISFCHTTCLFQPNGTSFSPRCNEAVKNFAPFSRAFSCPLGSEMNPSRKCHYF